MKIFVIQTLRKQALKQQGLPLSTLQLQVFMVISLLASGREMQHSTIWECFKQSYLFIFNTSNYISSGNQGNYVYIIYK